MSKKGKLRMQEELKKDQPTDQPTEQIIETVSSGGPSNIQKIVLLSDLAKLITDKEFASYIKSKPSGSYIFEIFQNAAESAIDSIMSPKADNKDISNTLENVTISLSDVAMNMTSLANSLNDTINRFASHEVVEALSMLNSKLTGMGSTMSAGTHSRTMVQDSQAGNGQVVASYGSNSSLTKDDIRSALAKRGRNV